jgi:PKD repeat protein
LNGSDSGVVFNVYQSFGGGLGGLGFIGCVGPGGSLEFTAAAGGTYYIQVGSIATGPAHVQLDVQEVPPPANDDFVNAPTIGALPFTDSVDMTSATTEAGEPVTPSGSFTPIAASAWYAFTPATTASLSASADSCCVTPILTVYTGTSLTNLTEVPSLSGFGPTMTFGATGGVTYYFQLGRGSLSGGTAPMSFHLQITPPPVADFGLFPSDPSIFDTIQFYDFSFDPGQVAFQSEVWDFGDGTGGTGCCPTHRYAADGDYTVKLTVTTLDGRTASTAQVVHVMTHDVAITKLAVPVSASAGQTRHLTVGVGNSRYPENVQIQLFKSVPGSVGNFQLVGTLTQLVPVLPANRTIPFDFSYTFTTDDAAVGKVTFEAVATIIVARDAESADNTAIASPTRVNR